MRSTFVIFLICFFSEANSQLALINDPEGCSNVREFPNSKSKVTDTLRNETIVFAFEDQVQDNWFPVDYKKNGQTLTGYVHRSRLKFLTGLKPFKTTSSNDSVLILKLESFEMKFSRKKFAEKGKTLKYSNPPGEAAYVKYIDGKTPWGTDGNLPRKEYKAIQFKNGNRISSFPASSYTDLFEPSFDYTHAWYDKKTNRIFIEAMNGDGAGGYVVVWVIEKGKLKSRETFVPF
jgi:Bacterial SH3 domain